MPKVKRWYVINDLDPNDMEGPFDSEEEANEVRDELNRWNTCYVEDSE